MMNMKNFLLGFDAREMWCDFQSSWSDERRDAYLLRKDILKPLSTDIMVWPSVFDTQKEVELSGLKLEVLTWKGLILPSWIGPNRPLWENLAHLRKHLAEHWIDRTKPYWIIAIDRLSEAAIDNESIGSWPYLNSTLPSSIDANWRLLGYDVSDSFFLSGLSNCGFGLETQNVQFLRNQWGPFLNRYHLFDDFGQAILFKEFSNQRVREHAPFFVYGIWLIEESEGSKHMAK